jgi:hypothetical protein
VLEATSLSWRLARALEDGISGEAVRDE